MGHGQGLLKQITEPNTHYYESLTVETLTAFLRELQAQPKRELVIPIGSFGSRLYAATVTNNRDELAKLAQESLEAKILNYRNKSTYMKIDYDLVYMLSSTFDLKITFDRDIVWGIETKYNHENEYDDSYEAKQLVWREGKWFLETYSSDGGYSYSKTFSKELSEKEVFNLICNEDKNNETVVL